MPDPKTYRQHFENKHPKNPLPDDLKDVASGWLYCIYAFDLDTFISINIYFNVFICQHYFRTMEETA